MRKESPARLLLPALAAGGAGMLLRVLLYRTGFDDRGLLELSNPAHLLCWLLALVLALFLARSVGKEESPTLTLPAPLRAAAAAAAAVLLVIHTLGLLVPAHAPLQWVRVALGALCAASAALCGYLQLRGRNTPAPLYVPACLFFAVDMLCRYQSWSGNPQLADYCFALAGSVCLCLTAYQRMALPAELGSRKIHLFSGLMALCLCLYSLVGTGAATFYLAGACWTAANLDVPQIIIPEEKEEETP